VTDNKAPSYPWYPRDFAADEPVQLMSLAEEGAYRRLLDHQWLHGSVPGGVEALSCICKNTPIREMRKIWAKIEPCFVRMEGQPPRYQNRRLERVRQERKCFLNKQSENGKRGAEARWKGKPGDGDPIGEPMASPMANESLAVAFASASAVNNTLPTEAAKPVSEVSRGQLLGALRKVCGPRGGKASEAVMRTNASCIDTLAGRQWTYADIHQAALGTRSLSDRGKIGVIPPGAEWSLKYLVDRTPDVDPMQRGLDAYRAQAPPPAEEKRGGAVTGIGVIDFSKFMKGA
jgi:uncharacterized protein YdaU (DUF1376 family)